LPLKIKIPGELFITPERFMHEFGSFLIFSWEYNSDHGEFKSLSGLGRFRKDIYACLAVYFASF
jgi:hypothetical protein